MKYNPNWSDYNGWFWESKWKWKFFSKWVMKIEKQNFIGPAGSYELASVRPSVRLKQKLPYFPSLVSLIFCKQLALRRVKKWQTPIFLKKVWFLGKSGKSAKIRWKMCFSNFLKFSRFFQRNILHLLAKTVCLGKVWFSRYFKKGSQLIRLQYFPNLNISWTSCI